MYVIFLKSKGFNDFKYDMDMDMSDMNDLDMVDIDMVDLYMVDMEDMDMVDMDMVDMNMDMDIMDMDIMDMDIVDMGKQGLGPKGSSVDWQDTVILMQISPHTESIFDHKKNRKNLKCQYVAVNLHISCQNEGGGVKGRLEKHKKFFRFGCSLWVISGEA